MSKIIRFVSFLDSISEWTGKICCWAVVPLVLVVTYEVISRKIFNSPHVWSLELPTMIFTFLWMMLAAQTLYHGRHVAIDMFSNRLSPKARVRLEIFLYLCFFFPFTITVLVGGIKFAATSWSMLEINWTPWRPPIYPFKTLIPVMALLLLLQGISIFSKKLVFLFKGVKV